MIREDGYRALRQPRTTSQKLLFDKYAVLSRITVEVGKSIAELMFRTKTGATIIAIERNKKMHTSPDPKFSFEAGDMVFITGNRENINRAIAYLTEGKL
jgi:K+/H+ antiporter YhaU regulatory subunit KhtT